jgi:steroid delta-isomerase-like uncharacterized protein
MAETSTGAGAESPEAAEQARPKRGRITRRKAVEEHARSYFDALARRDASGMVEHWSDDGVADMVPFAVLRGQDEIASFFRELFAGVPDLETTVTRVVAGERQAAVEWRMTGHFTGEPLQGIEATGRAIALRGVDLLEVEDGKIVSNTAHYDGMAFARQVGLLPPQDSPAERALRGAFNATTRARKAVADWRGAG